jgi:hypothetical protein
MKTSVFVVAIALIVAVLSGCKSPDAFPPKHFDNLVIQGTPKFDEQVEQALALLKARSPQGYATVTNYVGIIQEFEHSGMQVHHRPPIFQLNGTSAYYSVSWCAGVIAHDSFHSKLYFDYKKQHPWALRVPPGIYGGEQGERACLDHQLFVLKDIGAPTNEIEWCRQSANQTNQYWKVKYKDRNW